MYGCCDAVIDIIANLSNGSIIRIESCFKIASINSEVTTIVQDIETENANICAIESFPIILWFNEVSLTVESSYWVLISSTIVVLMLFCGIYTILKISCASRELQF